MDARVLSSNVPDADSYIGFKLAFPMGKDQKSNEDAGFGVRHFCESALLSCLVLLYPVLFCPEDLCN